MIRTETERFNKKFSCNNSATWGAYAVAVTEKRLAAICAGSFQEEEEHL